MKTLLIPVLLLICMAGCATTTVTNEWKDPDYSGTALQSVIVLGLPAGLEIGRLSTDEFVKQLKDRGMYAVSGYSAPFAAVLSQRTVLAKARELDIKMVLVSRFLDNKTEMSFNNVDKSGVMLMPGFDIWADDQYYVLNDFQVFRTILYDAASGKAIWSAVSDTFVNGSEKRILKSYVKAMLKKMEGHGLLKQQH